MVIRPLLIGLTLILALILVILSILLVNPIQPMRQSESLLTGPTGTNQQQ